MSVVTAYVCTRCDVGGDDPALEPRCWNCGTDDHLKVTARPVRRTVPANG